MTLEGMVINPLSSKTSPDRGTAFTLFDLMLVGSLGMELRVPKTKQLGIPNEKLLKLLSKESKFSRIVRKLVLNLC